MSAAGQAPRDTCRRCGRPMIAERHVGRWRQYCSRRCALKDRTPKRRAAQRDLEMGADPGAWFEAQLRRGRSARELADWCDMTPRALTVWLADLGWRYAHGAWRRGDRRRILMPNNLRWTPAEDDLLRHAPDYRPVLARLPHRSLRAVRRRWYQLGRRAGTKGHCRGPQTLDEYRVARLLAACRRMARRHRLAIDPDALLDALRDVWREVGR